MRSFGRCQQFCVFWLGYHSGGDSGRGDCGPKAFMTAGGSDRFPQLRVSEQVMGCAGVHRGDFGKPGRGGGGLVARVGEVGGEDRGAGGE
jgi:hypothetical protein